MCFGGFLLPEVRKNSKNVQIFIFGFQCVAKNIERWSTICTSYLVGAAVKPKKVLKTE